jgi:serine/threonine-protein kinase
VHYLAQAAEAVAEAHAAGIVHRDLKPANLFLIQRANGTPCVKVLDFGIAKLTHGVGDGVGDEAGLTATGVLLGSPLYMAPEQMVRSKNVDARADIWALGVTLYELLTGVSPFKGKTMPEIVANVLQEDPPAPSTNIPAVPLELDALVARCLRKSASERFQTANELVDALRDIEKSLGNPSNPTSLRGIERSSSQSLPFQSTVGVAMVPALVLDNEPSKSARRGGTLLGFLLGVFVVSVLGICLAVWKTRGAESAVEGVGLASSATTNGMVSASASASAQAEQAPVLPTGSQVVMGAKAAPAAGSGSPKAPLKKAAVQRRVVTDHLDEFR